MPASLVPYWLKCPLEVSNSLPPRALCSPHLGTPLMKYPIDTLLEPYAHHLTLASDSNEVNTVVLLVVLLPHLWKVLMLRSVPIVATHIFAKVSIALITSWHCCVRLEMLLSFGSRSLCELSTFFKGADSWEGDFAFWLHPLFVAGSHKKVERVPFTAEKGSRQTCFGTQLASQFSFKACVE